MAARDTSQRQDASLDDTVTLDCLVAILRARWVEAAGWRESRRDETLVEANQEQGKSFHSAKIL